MKKVNRRTIKKMLKSGNYEGYPNQTKEYKPVNICDDFQTFESGFLNILTSDFSTKVGYGAIAKDGTIVLKVHSELYYHFHEVE